MNKVTLLTSVYAQQETDKIMADSRLIQSENSGYASDEHDCTSESSNMDCMGISQNPVETTARANREIVDIIDNKNKMHHDLFRVLDKYKGIISNPTHIQVNGLNMLQMIVDKGRQTFFVVVIQMGWWKILADKKTGSGSVYEDKTAKQIAEVKPGRKLLDEFNIHHAWDCSLTPLMKACRSRDFCRANQLVEKPEPDVYLCDDNGNDCLYWAVISGNTDLFDKLVDLGLNAKTRNKKSETMLHVACQTGRPRFIETLLKRYELDHTLMDVGKKTALNRAAEAGDVAVLTEFVKCGVQPDTTSLVLSAYSGRLSFLRFCLEHLHLSLESVDMYGRTALHRACEGSRVAAVRYLLQKGCSVLSCTTMKRNLLHIVAESGNLDIMDLITDALRTAGVLNEMINQKDRYNGVDLCFLVRGRDKGRDAYHYVEVERFKVSLFLKKTKSGNVDIAEYGSVVQSGWGVNPSQEVVDEIEEIFKTRRLDTLAVEDMTPLQVALAKGNSLISKKLVELGADVNTRDKFGLTPILLAASKGDLDSVCLLEKAGADLKARCNAGHGIKELAILNEHKSIVNFAASDDNYLTAKKFVMGPLLQFSQIMKQFSGNDKKVHIKDKEILVQARQLGEAVDRALLELGSSPVQQATDDQSHTQNTSSKDISTSQVSHTEESGIVQESGLETRGSARSTVECTRHTGYRPFDQSNMHTLSEMRRRNEDQMSYQGLPRNSYLPRYFQQGMQNMNENVKVY